MYEIQIYSRRWRYLFRGRRQYYWKCVFTQGAIKETVAIGGEGYYNLEDLEASLHHFLVKGPTAPILYMDAASQKAHAT